MISKRYDVYYRLNNSSQKHILISTNEIDTAIKFYSNFICDNYFSSDIDCCVLVDNYFIERLMYTDFLF